MHEFQISEWKNEFLELSCYSSVRQVAIWIQFTSCVTVCCSVLQRVAVCGKYLLNLQVRHVCQSALQCVAVRCSALHCVAVCCSLSQCVECVAVCCSVLQCPIRSQFILYTRWNIFFKVLVTHCMTLHDTAWHCSTLQHTATYCITLQHTAWHVQGLYSY